MPEICPTDGIKKERAKTEVHLGHAKQHGFAAGSCYQMKNRFSLSLIMKVVRIIRAPAAESGRAGPECCILAGRIACLRFAESFAAAAVGRSCAPYCRMSG